MLNMNKENTPYIRSLVKQWLNAEKIPHEAYLGTSGFIVSLNKTDEIVSKILIQFEQVPKTAKVYTGRIKANVSFKNVIFAGKLNLFRKESDEKEIREYRVQFENLVVFENCTFEKDVNFELTNFNEGVSFANSVFKIQPLFVRIGLEKFADLESVVFEQDAIFQFAQNNPRKVVSVSELETILKKSLEN